jgi:hyperosmotically inducible protein
MLSIRKTAALTILGLLTFAGNAVFGVGNSATDPRNSAQQAADQQMQADNALSPQDENRLIREVRHELLMLPYYGVFDDLQYKVDGHTVTLVGYVTSEHAVTKNDAERVVKRIEGVEKVINNIEVLPPSPMDDRLRLVLNRKIYGYGPLFKYANMSIPPIHIVVKNGHVILDGVVDTETDKNLVTLRANQVPGVFSVTNNLVVVGSQTEKSKTK